MSLLEFSQILFNFVGSLAILIVAAVFVGVGYYALKFVKATKEFAKTIKEDSMKIYQKLDMIASTIFTLPFLSKIFKKKKR